jgi:hypothetical protein
MSKLFLCLILVLPLVVGLQITEVELNPLGGRAENEWIEFYNPSENPINVSFWKINDSLKERFVIPSNTTIRGGKYYVVEFNSPILNNGGDSVFLSYPNNSLVDKIENLEERTSSTKTHQLCNNEWIFQEQTKNKENCEKILEQKNKTPEKNSTNNETSSNKQEKENFFERKKSFSQNLSSHTKNITKETIQLNPKTIKKEKTTSSLGEKNYAKYSIIGFCILLFSLYLIKSRKKKNEWQ